eukprot:TRINITY_DN121097_c0_g1_i1.p1 TRINITY_DN121097_c0_g1~~TRINITY_DN121097_c0_g1_i1.p1  ORF type:complete len:544 (+),score=34.02 TRINITY_DN121097_c0_g1_i1:1336-2967(+)
MPAYSLSGRLSKLGYSLLHQSLRNPNTVHHQTPMIKSTTPSKKNLQGTIPTKDYITVRQRVRNQERYENLRKQRKQWREEQKRLYQERINQQEEYQEDSPKVEPITVQITETRTRSERVEPKLEADKKASKVKEKTANTKADRKNLPPGPGQYTLPSDVIPLLSPLQFNKCTKGTSFAPHRVGGSAKSTAFKEPGPGAFDIPTNIGGPKFSFGNRFDGISFDHPALKMRRHLIQREEKQPEFLALPSTIGKGAGVKLDPPRTKQPTDKSLAVGPGSYNPKPVTLAQSYSMLGRPAARAATAMVPGPGEYAPEKALSYIYPVMTKNIREDILETKQGAASEVPGPGAYDPRPLDKIKGPRMMPKTASPIKPVERERKINVRDSPSEESSTLKRIDKNTFGKAQRGELAIKTITPGPDAYQRIETDWRKKQDESTMGKESCTFGMKTMKFFQPNTNPGPGNYAADMIPNGPYYSVGKGPRSGQEFPIYTDNYYDAPNILPGPTITFGGERKQTETKKSKYPGPGTYNIPSTIGEIPTYLLKAESS